MSKHENPKEKFGRQKTRIGCVPVTAIAQIAEAMHLGAMKYGSYNWRHTRVARMVYLEAAFRHLMLAVDGEDCDEESGLPHEAHAAANLCILLDAISTGGNMVDDRPKTRALVKIMKQHSIRSIKGGDGGNDKKDISRNRK